MSMTTHTILAGHSWVLVADTDRVESFLCLFRSCWDKVPAAAQTAITEHWGGSPVPLHPKIELSDCWADSNDCFAQTGFNGMELRFSRRDFAILPDSVATWIIAHELAHVYQKAIGRRPGGASEDENEADADSIASGWGFDKIMKVLLDAQLRRGRSLDKACEVLRKFGTSFDC